MLTHHLPFPPDRGDRVRKYEMLRELSRHHRVTLACVEDGTARSDVDPDDVMRELRSLTDRLIVRRIDPRVGKLRGLAAMVFAGGAISANYTYRADMARQIVRWHRREPFDAVLTVCTNMARYSRPLNHEKHPPWQVMELMDIDSHKWAELAQAARFPMSAIYRREAQALHRVELGEFDRFDHITLVSDREVDLYRRKISRNLAARVSSVRQGARLDFFTPFADVSKLDPNGPNCRNMVFVSGLSYMPSVQAITWFADHVLPRVRERVPDATLTLVGRSPCDAIVRLGKREGIRLVGPVPDVRPFLRDAAVAIAPMRMSIGVQTKVIEAMAAGRAVIGSVGTGDGIVDPNLAEAGRDLVVADTPEEWTEELADLLTNPSRRETIARHARACVERCFGWESCLAGFADLMRRPDAAQGYLRMAS